MSSAAMSTALPRTYLDFAKTAPEGGLMKTGYVKPRQNPKQYADAQRQRF